MKLQFNLLPDVKQEYLKTQRTKRTVITAAIVSSSIALFILLFMLTNVYVINKKQLSDADKDIDKYSHQLKTIPDLDKILTVQHQLDSLAGLHQNKHKLSRVYDYLPQVTPIKVHMSQVSIDLVANTMTIQGTADNHKTVNTFIDTLKFTTYKIDGNDAVDDKGVKLKAFPSVIESQFGLGEGGANYQLTIQFDPTLFSNTQNVGLSVPEGLSTTRSVMDDPSKDLFNGKPEDQPDNSDNGGGQQ
jgi:Tfp pilus assembly protein PilN